MRVLALCVCGSMDCVCGRTWAGCVVWRERAVSAVRAISVYMYVCGVKGHEVFGVYVCVCSVRGQSVL